MEVSRERGKSCPDWIPSGLELSERKQKDDLPKTTPMCGLRLRRQWTKSAEWSAITSVSFAEE